MQKIESLQPDKLLRERQLAEMDTLYVGAYYRGTTNKYLLTFEPDEATWLQFKASVPKGAIIHHQLYWTNGDPTGTEKPEDEPASEPKAEKPKKEKEPTPYGQYWAALHRWGLDNALPLADVLGLDRELKNGDIHEALRKGFEVEHLSRSVSPGMFEEWCDVNGLHYIVSESKLIRAKLEQEKA